MAGCHDRRASNGLHLLEGLPRHHYVRTSTHRDRLAVQIKQDALAAIGNTLAVGLLLVAYLRPLYLRSTCPESYPPNTASTS